MKNGNLRVFRGPSTQHSCGHSDNVSEQPEGRVEVRLADIFPLLADAAAAKRTWLEDFAEDKIDISADLFDVIATYQWLGRTA